MNESSTEINALEEAKLRKWAAKRAYKTSKDSVERKRLELEEEIALLEARKDDYKKCKAECKALKNGHPVVKGLVISTATLAAAALVAKKLGLFDDSESKWDNLRK